MKETVNPAAEGGNVWSRPEVKSVQSPKHSAFKSFIRKVFPNSSVVVILIMTIISILFIASYGTYHYKEHIMGRENRQQQAEIELEAAYQQEYGFSNVETVFESGRASVTTSNGEQKEIKAVIYQGARVLFETKEQRDEKFEDVDAGTYPPELMTYVKSFEQK